MERLLPKNGSVTATIMVKPECLAHCSVEQDFLYPLIYYTGLNFTEAKTIVILHVLEYNFTQGHLFDSWGQAHYDSSCSIAL